MASCINNEPPAKGTLPRHRLVPPLTHSRRESFLLQTRYGRLGFLFSETIQTILPVLKDRMTSRDSSPSGKSGGVSRFSRFMSGHLYLRSSGGGFRASQDPLLQAGRLLSLGLGSCILKPSKFIFWMVTVLWQMTIAISLTAPIILISIYAVTILRLDTSTESSR
ncbi:hypothetical protein IW261DRAFT_866835 [Armillaria novae-zelandiae]|uniref:Uncharacterized protein n=1 Tax=Armillaria novae-zelandiae TaxID=153914 RepID=A0AA39UFD4_9AGAR|nr:hypothetical protein IW261DRAFT_866835 [Armillaria novae-zelandiae]